MMKEEENKVEVEKQGSKGWRVLKKVAFWMLFLGVPLVLTAPIWIWGVLYVKIMLDPYDLTPSDVEGMIDARFKNFQEFRIEMGNKHNKYKKESITLEEAKSLLQPFACKIILSEYADVDMKKAVWCDSSHSEQLVEYVYPVRTRSIYDQTFSMGTGVKHYYCLLDKDCRILGWVFPEE